MMRKFTMIVSLFCALATSPWSHAQKVASQSSSLGSLDVTLLYDASYTNTSTSRQFWMQGGAAELHAQLWKGLGAVARVDGMHTANMQGSGVGLDLVATNFGVRYTAGLNQIYPGLATRLDAKGHLSFYGQALGGETYGLHSLFPIGTQTEDEANSVSLLVGGGANYRLNHRWSVRILDAEWMRNTLPNATTNAQNQLVIGSGITLHVN